MNIKDLQIEKEILPLFDYTLNDFSKEVILEMLTSPLSTKDEIIVRHEILKGFTFNHITLKNYGYSVSYLTEVFYFLQNNNLEHIEKKKFNYKLFTSSKNKLIHLNKLTQLVLLFNKLQFDYFSRLNLLAFPRQYRNEIKKLIDFLDALDIQYFALLIKDSKFKISHILDLTKKIIEQKSNAKVTEFWSILFQFEAYLSINKGILKNNFVFPTCSKDKLVLQNFYHPLLQKPVLNDFSTTSNVIVLTGSNMSGKSTFLKAVGLCIYLTQIGVGVPASKAEIPLYETISVSINHEDDIHNGYSHFMNEVLNLKNVVNGALSGNKVFAVFDELFSGTNIDDALEICTTTLNGLSKFKNSTFIISTHLHQLKELIEKENQISTYYIDCELINNCPTFSYKLKRGWSKLKVGKILFENEGLNKLLG